MIADCGIWVSGGSQILSLHWELWVFETVIGSFSAKKMKKKKILPDDARSGAIRIVHWCCTDSTPVLSNSICEDCTTNKVKDFNILYLKYLNSCPLFFLKAKSMFKNNHLMSKQALTLKTLILQLSLGFGVYSWCLYKPP